MLKMLTTYIHTTTEAYVSYKLTTEPSAQVSENMSLPFCSKQAAFCISNLCTTKLVQIKYIQNIQFSISIRRYPFMYQYIRNEQNRTNELSRSFQTSAYNALYLHFGKKCVAKSDGWMSSGF